MSGEGVILGVSQKGKKFEITGIESAEKLEQDFTTILRSKNKFNVLINPRCAKYNIEREPSLAFFISSSEQKGLFLVLKT
jgi:ATP-dependent DNA helicase RecG